MKPSKGWSEFRRRSAERKHFPTDGSEVLILAALSPPTNTLYALLELWLNGRMDFRRKRFFNDSAPIPAHNCCTCSVLDLRDPTLIQPQWRQLCTVRALLSPLGIFDSFATCPVLLEIFAQLRIPPWVWGSGALPFEPLQCGSGSALSIRQFGPLIDCLQLPDIPKPAIEDLPLCRLCGKGEDSKEHLQYWCAAVGLFLDLITQQGGGPERLFLQGPHPELLLFAWFAVRQHTQHLREMSNETLLLRLGLSPLVKSLSELLHMYWDNLPKHLKTSTIPARFIPHMTSTHQESAILSCNKLSALRLASSLQLAITPHRASAGSLPHPLRQQGYLTVAAPIPAGTAIGWKCASENSGTSFITNCGLLHSPREVTVLEIHSAHWDRRPCLCGRDSLVLVSSILIQANQEITLSCGGSPFKGGSNRPKVQIFFDGSGKEPNSLKPYAAAGVTAFYIHPLYGAQKNCRLAPSASPSYYCPAS